MLYIPYDNQDFIEIYNNDIIIKNLFGKGVKYVCTSFYSTNKKYKYVRTS